VNQARVNPPGVNSAGVKAAGTRAAGLVRLDPATAALVLLVVTGVVVRVGLWWQSRAFWRDELALVQSLDAYSLRELVGPLSDAQSAPPGWLLLVRTTTWVLGDGEQPYRLVALVSGCAAIAAIAVLACRLVRSRWAALVPVLLLATLSQLVFYTAQTKQYASDVLLVTALLLLGTRMLGDPAAAAEQRVSDETADPPHHGDQGAGHADGRAVHWYVALAVLPWFSHAAMLIAPFVAGWVALVQLWRREVGVARLAARLALPAASVLGAALHARHLTGQVSDFTTYWAGFMGPRQADLGQWLDWHRFVFTDFAHHVLGFPTPWGWVLVVAGFAVAVRRRPTVAILLVLPLLAAYTVGVLGLYPFGRRLALFCVPGLLVPLGVLVDAVAVGVARRTRRWARPLAAGVAGVAATAVVTAACFTSPARLAHDLEYLYGVDDYRTALTFVADKWQDGDVLLVGGGDRAAVRVYGPRLGIPTERAFRALPSADTTERYRCPLPQVLASASRIWLVTGDAVPIYQGTPSRYALVAPLLSRFHVVWHQVRGRVTVQAVMPGAAAERRPARCLVYAPVGKAGDPAYPRGLPAS
jgi:hypothetical protein